MHKWKDTNGWKSHAEYLAEAWYLHTCSIKLVFFECSKISLFEADFELRCFQLLSLNA